MKWMGEGGWGSRNELTLIKPTLAPNQTPSASHPCFLLLMEVLRFSRFPCWTYLWDKSRSREYHLGEVGWTDSGPLQRGCMHTSMYIIIFQTHRLTLYLFCEKDLPRQMSPVFTRCVSTQANLQTIRETEPHDVPPCIFASLDTSVLLDILLICHYIV